MKKLLVSDYDQTFYLNDEDIEKNKIAVKEFRNKGNIFVIATGRSYGDFMKKKEQYNIEYDYVIINHGATILDKEDNIIFKAIMPNEILDSLKSDLHIENTERQFCCSLLESRVEFEHKNLTKVHVKYNDLEYSNEIQKNLEEKYGDVLNIYYVSGNSIEIISKNTNKIPKSTKPRNFTIRSVILCSNGIYSTARSCSVFPNTNTTSVNTTANKNTIV